MHPILRKFSGLMVDLDGTVFEGNRPVDGAKEGLADHQVAYITNNASRSPAEVAVHLNELGFTAKPEQVMTSAMAACLMARSVFDEQGKLAGLEIDEDRKVFVIGAESFKQLARDAGLKVVKCADDNPAVVLHGHSPDNNWERLSEGALAIQRGARYIASNLDSTLPTERGFMVGNGSMVAAVTNATGVVPDAPGKPQPTMFEACRPQFKGQDILVIGDRLNTDIAGGNNAHLPTLCTVTGVSTHRDILAARGVERPTYIAANMRDHLSGWTAAVVGEDVAGDDDGSASPSTTTVEVHISAGEEGQDMIMAAEALAAAAPVVWSLVDAGTALEDITFTGDCPAARTAIAAWR